MTLPVTLGEGSFRSAGARCTRVATSIRWHSAGVVMSGGGDDVGLQVRFTPLTRRKSRDHCWTMTTTQGEPSLLVDVVTIDGVPAVRLVGELDLNGAGKLLDAGMRLLEQPDAGPVVVIDVAELAFCDSSGLHILHQLQRNAAALDRTVMLRSPQPIVRRVLQLTGMDEIITTLPLDR